MLRFDWIDPNGVTHDLTTSGLYFLRPEITGLGTAGSDISDEKLPTAPGAVVRRVTTPPTRIGLPITIIAGSLGALITALDDLRGWFDTGDETGRRPGYLQVTRPDGSIRILQCYYAGGLEGDMAHGGDTWAEYDVKLYAPDPWPTAPAWTITTWLPADLPNVTQINQGQLDAYPLWTITGPASVINVGNITTGKNWSLVFALGSGKTVTVDTRPASQRTNIPVIDSDGINRFPALYPGSQIFGNWLLPGTNTFSISVVGQTSATRIGLAYLARYRGAVR